MADNTIELAVKVNAETGQLDLLAGKLGTVGSVAAGMLTAFGIEATGRGILNFFKESIHQAEDEALAMRRLTAVYGDSAGAIKEWAEGLQRATSFSNSQAISSFERLSKTTRSVAEAQAASKLAMDISIATGKELGSVTEVLFNLINGQTRAVKAAHNEFGNLVKIYGTGQEAINALIQKYNGAAEKEQGLSRETKTLSNQFDDFQKHVGNAVIPALTAMIKTLNESAEGYEKLHKVMTQKLTPVKAEDYMGKLDINKVVNDNKKMIDGLNKQASDATKGGAKGKGILPQILAVDEFQVELERAQEAFNKAQDAMIRKKIATTAILKNRTQELVDAEVKGIEFVRDLRNKAAEEFVQGFSKSISQAIIEGKNFQDSMEQVFKSVIENIIEAIIQMTIFRTLASAGFGGAGMPVGGFLPWGARGSPSSPKTTSPFSLNPSSLRAQGASIRTITQYNGGKPYAF